MAANSDQLRDVFQILKQCDSDQLSIISQRIIELRKVHNQDKAAELRLTLKVGSIVRISSTCKPKYLARQRGEIIQMKGDKVLLKMDAGPQGKFRTGQIWCPLSLIEVS